MFDVGFAEIFLLALIGLIVIGPEKLPRVARTVGGMVRRARSSWYSLRRSIETELTEADVSAPIRDAAKEMQEAGRQIDQSLKQAVESRPDPAKPAEDKPVTEKPVEEKPTKENPLKKNTGSRKMADHPKDDREQTFLQHLIELRGRLIRSCLSIFVILVCLLPFARKIYAALAAPLMARLPEGTSMIAIDVASPFLTPFKLTLLVSVLLAMPYILFQIWAFVAPALFKHEKRLAKPLLFSSIALFYLGCAFAYFVVFPLVFSFLTRIAPEGVEMMTDISKYLDFVTTLFLAFGITFEVPIATIILVAAGITTPNKLASIRPYIIVGAFALGMLLTPPDVISQTLLAIPMWLLYEVGIMLSRLVVPDDEADQATS